MHELVTTSGYQGTFLRGHLCWINIRTLPYFSPYHDLVNSWVWVQRLGQLDKIKYNFSVLPSKWNQLIKTSCPNLYWLWGSLYSFTWIAPFPFDSCPMTHPLLPWLARAERAAEAASGVSAASNPPAVWGSWSKGSMVPKIGAFSYPRMLSTDICNRVRCGGRWWHNTRAKKYQHIRTTGSLHRQGSNRLNGKEKNWGLFLIWPHISKMTLLQHMRNLKIKTH